MQLIDTILHQTYWSLELAILCHWIKVHQQKTMTKNKHLLNILSFTVSVSKIRRSTLKCQNTPLKEAETKIDDSILLPVKSSYIFW